MNRQLRSTLTACVVAFAVLAGTTAVSAQNENDPGPDCADFSFVGLRGSGEPETDGFGAGTRVGQVWSDLLAIYEDNGTPYRIDFAPILYTAAGAVNPLNYLSNLFFTSADNGHALLDAYIATERNRCPDKRFVLAGFSQGAMVVNRWLHDEPDLSDIAAVVLLADPARVDEAPYNVGNPSGDGITYDAGALPIVPAQYRQGELPAEIHDRTFSYCAGKDPVCTGLDTAAFVGRHTSDTYYVDRYPPRAAGKIDSILQRLAFETPFRPTFSVAYGQEALFDARPTPNARGSFEVVQGQLPVGLRLREGNGRIVGTTRDGRAQPGRTLTLRHTDELGTSVDYTVDLDFDYQPQQFSIETTDDARIENVSFDAATSQVAHQFSDDPGAGNAPRIVVTDLSTETDHLITRADGVPVNANTYVWCGIDQLAIHTADSIDPTDVGGDNVYLYNTRTRQFQLLDLPTVDNPLPLPGGPDPDLGPPSCSRSGKFVAYVSGDEVLRYNTLTGRLRSIATDLGSAFFEDPVPTDLDTAPATVMLSPNGRYAAIVAEVYGNGDENFVTFWTDIRTGDVEVIDGPLNDPNDVNPEVFLTNEVLLYTAPDLTADQTTRSRLFYRQNSTGQVEIGMPHLDVEAGSVDGSGRWYSYHTITPSGVGAVWLSDFNFFETYQLATAGPAGAVRSPAVAATGNHVAWLDFPNRSSLVSELRFLNTPRRGASPTYFDPPSD